MQVFRVLLCYMVAIVLAGPVTSARAQDSDSDEIEVPAEEDLNRPHKLPRVGIGFGIGPSDLGPHASFVLSEQDVITVTILPIVSSEFAFVSFGAKYAHVLVDRDASQLYFVGAMGAFHLSDEGTIYIPGVGAGLSNSKLANQAGFTPWVELKLCAWIGGDDFLILPLPSAGLSWFF